MASSARSQLYQCFSPPTLRSYLAEFISTFLLVFAAVGSTISARMLTPDVTSDASSLVATAASQSFAIFAATYIAGDISGAHINPAVTFAFVLGGHIAIPTAVFYWISQLLGSTLACLLLRFASAGQAVPTTKIATEMTGFGGAVVEGVITFMLVYTVHVAADPRVADAGRKGGAVSGALAVGMVVGGCALAAGSLTGGSMNPARSFGPAIVSGDFKNHGVYWVGPLIGAALAALVHQNLVFPSPSPSDEEALDV
ncbi:probable aquaporin TIP5-1 [Phalaenopsis equestris]|uniref:probable aquaporin TIP5-1 n=1 Tax=Phalaenopsis equestris TaxID=78828 RepID=UPI0009E5638C|nr:probable aquaporin TIP5-1 [Phalaenopsis equestris]